MGGYSQNTCYAFSHDGLKWEKPALDVVAGTNITLSGHRDSSTVWLDQMELDTAPPVQARLFVRQLPAAVRLARRHPLAGARANRERRATAPRSSTTPSAKSGCSASATSSAGWTASAAISRVPTFIPSARWSDTQPVLWVSADPDDPRRSGIQRADRAVQPGLRRLREHRARPVHDLPRRTRWTARSRTTSASATAVTDFTGHGRIGSAFIPVSEHVGDWNWANVQSAGGCCLVVGDRLYFYVSGRRGVPGTTDPGVCSTGLATLRRDGFVSMERPRRRPRHQPHADGVATRHADRRRPVTFNGRFLFVNASDRRRAARRGSRPRGRASSLPTRRAPGACRSAAIARRWP